MSEVFRTEVNPGWHPKRFLNDMTVSERNI
jgi:hypothetical protein